MSRLLWLADVLRAAGLTVLETAGWRTRGKEGMRPKVVIAHHTATHWTTPDSAVTNVLINGRSDLPGPLCHLGLNRQGHYIVIAAGKANHAGPGRWRDADESVETIGIEAYNYGNSVPFPTREPWPQAQLDAYDRGVAALLRHIGRDAAHLAAHREWATPPGRKPDPSGIDMDAMRARVDKLLKGDPVPFTPQEETILKELAAQGSFLVDMAKKIKAPGPTSQKTGNSESLLHVLETHRAVATKANVPATDHLALAAKILGQ